MAESRIPAKTGGFRVTLRRGMKTHVRAKLYCDIGIDAVRVDITKAIDPADPFRKQPDVFIHDALHEGTSLMMKTNAGSVLAQRTGETAGSKDKEIQVIGYAVSFAGMPIGTQEANVYLDATVMTADGIEMTGVILETHSPPMGEPFPIEKRITMNYHQVFVDPQAPFTMLPPAVPRSKTPKPTPIPTPEGGEPMSDKKSLVPPIIRAVVMRDPDTEIDDDSPGFESVRYLRAFLEPMERTDNELKQPKSGELVRFLVSQDGTHQEHLVEAKLDPSAGSVVAKVRIKEGPVNWTVSSPRNRPQRIKETHGEWPEATNPMFSLDETVPSGDAFADEPPADAPPLRTRQPAVKFITPSMVEREAIPPDPLRRTATPLPPMPKPQEPPKAPPLLPASSASADTWETAKTNPLNSPLQESLLRASKEGLPAPDASADLAKAMAESAAEPDPPPTEAIPLPGLRTAADARPPVVPQPRLPSPPPPGPPVVTEETEGIEEEGPMANPPKPEPPKEADPMDGWAFEVAPPKNQKPKPPPPPAVQEKESEMATPKEPGGSGHDQPPVRTVNVNVAPQPPPPPMASGGRGGTINELGMFALKALVLIVLLGGAYAVYHAVIDRGAGAAAKEPKEAKAPEGTKAVLEDKDENGDGVVDERDDRRMDTDLKPGDICYVISERSLIEISKWRAEDPRPVVSVDRDTKRPLVRVEHRDKSAEPYVARWTDEWDIDCENLLEMRNASRRR